MASAFLGEVEGDCILFTASRNGTQEIMSRETVSVTTYYLEMKSPDELRAKRVARSDVTVVRIDPPLPELNRFFYTAVGGDWFWIDRLPWSYQKWRDYLLRPELETWMLTVAGVPAGYVELEAQAEDNIEIAYFGLLPAFIGQGLGAHLLTAGIERAWQRGARRVWVHTCSLDHPYALAGYQARGFRLWKEETQQESLPPQPIGPWPGAR
jgi:GNAT superfamily N-acetyltransferase